MIGEVHDPRSYLLGGVAGHAGLFSTVDDLAIYCQMILNGGEYNGVRILSPLGVQRMTSARGLPENEARGLGWDINTGYSANRGDFFPVGSFGHTGFTGTSLWIDPGTQTFVVFLSNRVHPDGKGDVTSLRGRVASVVAASILEETSDLRPQTSDQKNSGQWTVVSGQQPETIVHRPSSIVTREPLPPHRLLLRPHYRRGDLVGHHLAARGRR
jgi:CubicO group peptidase (beta-lactamase class C family)